MDYSYLDPLAEEVYSYVYKKNIHKLEQSSTMESLKKRISELNNDEKEYIDNWVKNAFSLINTKNNKKTASK